MAAPTGKTGREAAEVIHGVTVSDHFRHLEAGSDPKVRSWVAEQNRCTRELLDASPRRAELANRLQELHSLGALGRSVMRGEQRFFTRRHAGQDQASLYVMDGSGVERCLVDPAPLTPDHTSSLDWWAPSEDGSLVCFGISEGGSEDSRLHLLETAGGRWLPDSIPHCKLAAVCFEPGSAALLYTRYPAPGSVAAGEEHYHRHVWRHMLGNVAEQDVRVFGESLAATDYPASISISADGRWTVIEVQQGWDRNQVFLRDGGGEFLPIFRDLPHRLHAWFEGNRLVGLTNLAAPNYRLVDIDPERPDLEAWQELVAESEHVLLEAAFARSALILHYLVDAASRLSLHRLDGAWERALQLPDLSTVSGLGAHHSSPCVPVTVESFLSPPRVIEAASGHLLAELPVPLLDHPVRQERLRSADGTRLPVFLIGRRSGRGQVLLTGYGGFNVSRTPQWWPSIVPFLDSGGLVAVATLRGGGEFGEAWHRAGRLEQKQNVFDDFLAAAEWLISQGLCSPAELGIMGGSNGGLLVGAAMTQRPDLFGAVVCRVPLLDMIRYERFRVARLWAAEYGSAGDPEQFRWLHAYSPYHQVREGAQYPAALFLTAEEDSRVDPMHALKMTARLQSAGAQAWLRVEERAGHGQGKPVSKLVEEEADVWTFLALKLRSPAAAPAGE
ncbi:MAG: prolyl oligopeptidase family serine peptidase [Candidatus Dormibacter sp.]|uniref:prolyl oligopeptidase family serine peptidase n=1 Tax=Candidatus Dormibacter sp. TaxID=2973982 RepID=UPI000DB60942|nr:MAG: S9 family peptidase [Candidatus Dormibacteraeota bacterium]